MFYLIQPFVMHESVQDVLRLALLQFFGGQGVGAVQDVSGRGFAILRAHDQLNLSINSSSSEITNNRF